MGLSVYTVDIAYCTYLRNIDSKVPDNSGHKSNRPFIGVVLEIDGVHYYAPLTSPKPKHLQMKNQPDFHKINGGVWGAINFNNMIPVPQNCLHPVDLKIYPTDSKADKDYKNLMIDQITWCSANASTLLKKAAKLRQLVVNAAEENILTKRCCDFSALEQACQNYNVVCV